MNSSLPALSLRQPWAWAILHAGKTIENRTWATRYRGRIRIHAAKTWDNGGTAFIHHLTGQILEEDAFHRAGWLGAYLGEVSLIGCHWLDQWQPERPGDAAWAFGPVCWELHAPEAYPEPIPGRGYPGLYLPERFERRRKAPEP